MILGLSRGIFGRVTPTRKPQNEWVRMMISNYCQTEVVVQPKALESHYIQQFDPSDLLASASESVEGDLSKKEEVAELSESGSEEGKPTKTPGSFFLVNYSIYVSQKS